MENVTLIRSSTDWKDKAVGWHHWRGTNTCPTCGKKFADKLSGTRKAAEEFVGECPECEEND